MIIEFLESQGYYDIRKLESVTGPYYVGLHDYAFTTGLVVGLTYESYERRYCYENESDAKDALDQFTNRNTHASGPWIKCKGRFEGYPIDILNEAFLNKDSQ